MKSGRRVIFTRGVVLASLILAVVLTVSVLGALWFSRPSTISTGSSTAVLSVICVPTSTPTMEILTPVVLESTTPEPQNQTLELIVIGSNVEVQGTGGAGLRVRQNPGLGQRVLFLANENEIFLVNDGPIEMDGYTWWYLVSPSDATRVGWGVTDYLQVVAVP
jgi:hypothetical protein